MELDVEIRLKSFPRAIALELGRRFPVDFKKAESNVVHQDVIVRATQEPQVATDIDKTVRDFLSSLSAHRESIKQSQGVLRLGVFYDLDETVVFPLRFSVETINALSDLGLSLDATGYPCAEEQKPKPKGQRGSRGQSC